MEIARISVKVFEDRGVKKVMTSVVKEGKFWGFIKTL